MHVHISNHVIFVNSLCEFRSMSLFLLFLFYRSAASGTRALIRLTCEKNVHKHGILVNLFGVFCFVRVLGALATRPLCACQKYTEIIRIFF